MGNTLGFVRMVRQAGLRHCTAALTIADRQPASCSPSGSLQHLDSSFESPGGAGHGRSGGRGCGGSPSGSSLGSDDGGGAVEGDEGVFEGRAREAGLSGGALEAAVVLDATLAELQAHATEGKSCAACGARRCRAQKAEITRLPSGNCGREGGREGGS